MAGLPRAWLRKTLTAVRAAPCPRCRQSTRSNRRDERFQLLTTEERVEIDGILSKIVMTPCPVCGRMEPDLSPVSSDEFHRVLDLLQNARWRSLPSTDAPS